MKSLLGHLAVLSFIVLLAACGGGGSGSYGDSGSSSSGGSGSGGSSSGNGSSSGGSSSGGGNINFSVWVSNGNNNSVTEITPAAISAGSCSTSTCIVFTGGGMNGAGPLTVDVHGDVWVANEPVGASSGSAPYSVTEITAEAVAAGACSSASCLNYTGGGIFAIKDITADVNGNIWVADSCAPTTNFAAAPCGHGNGGITEIKPGAAQDCSSGCIYFLIPQNSNNDGVPQLFPQGVTTDGQGNVWFTNNGCVVSNCPVNTGSLVEIPLSSVQAGSCSGCVLYSNGNIADPREVAVDMVGNAWVANSCGPANCFDYSGGSVTEIEKGASPDCSSGCVDYTGGDVSQPETVAVDNSGNIWVSDPALPGLTEITSAAATAGTCSVSSCVNFNTGGITVDTRAMAIDPNGDIWLTRSTDGTVLEVASGAPVDCSSGCIRISLPQSVQLNAEDVAIMP